MACVRCIAAGLWHATPSPHLLFQHGQVTSVEWREVVLDEFCNGLGRQIRSVVLVRWVPPPRRPSGSYPGTRQPEATCDVATAHGRDCESHRPGRVSRGRACVNGTCSPPGVVRATLLRERTGHSLHAEPLRKNITKGRSCNKITTHAWATLSSGPGSQAVWQCGAGASTRK
jgi:hypothetical protein